MSIADIVKGNNTRVITNPKNRNYTHVVVDFEEGNVAARFVETLHVPTGRRSLHYGLVNNHGPNRLTPEKRREAAIGLTHAAEKINDGAYFIGYTARNYEGPKLAIEREQWNAKNARQEWEKRTKPRARERRARQVRARQVFAR